MTEQRREVPSAASRSEWSGWLPLVGSLRVRLEFKLADAWVGGFWKVDRQHVYRWYDLWVCLLPCLPLHFAWERTQ